MRTQLHDTARTVTLIQNTYIVALWHFDPVAPSTAEKESTALCWCSLAAATLCCPAVVPLLWACKRVLHCKLPIEAQWDDTKLDDKGVQAEHEPVRSSLHFFKDHGAVRVKFSHPVAILMLAIAIIVVFFVVPGCVWQSCTVSHQVLGIVTANILTIAIAIVVFIAIAIIILIIAVIVIDIIITITVVMRKGLVVS